MNRKENIIIIFLFSGLLLFPLFFTDIMGGKISPTENRILASFPLSKEKDILHTGRKDVENWISDNIGFRSEFVRTYSIIMNRLFHLSTSPLVLFGRDGWYYYTGDHNIEIATGDYPLTESDLQKIAKYQQQVSDYYHSQGKEYILMLTPSKVSIYPEYLPMADETVDVTPVDIVADYLRKNTDILVYNSKPALLAAKEEGQLYHKTDTHWNERGSYAVYKGLFGLMEENGIVSNDMLSVSFDKGEYKGEFSAMLGNVNLLSPESAPIAKWEQHLSINPEGEPLSKMVAIQKMLNPSLGCSLIKNNSILNGKILQIFGDSQIEVFRKIPLYLAESFQDVYSYGIRKISPLVVDPIANPNVILFSCSERYIKDLLTYPSDIPVTIDFQNLGVKKFQTQGYGGMWTLCDNISIQQQGFLNANFFKEKDVVVLSGWAADFDAMKPLSALYVHIGDTILQCRYGIPDQSVVDYFGTPNLLNTGFEVHIPSNLLNSISEIEFIQVTADGSFCYAPVKYKLIS